MSNLTIDNSSANIALIRQLTRNVFGDDSVRACLALCQAIDESNLTGRPSELALNYNNLFGIKGEGTAGSVQMKTGEYLLGNHYVNTTANFARYSTLEDSVNAYRNLLVNGVSWNHDLYKPVLEADNFEDAANALVTCGYSTNPSYSANLISLYSQYCQGNSA